MTTVTETFNKNNNNFLYNDTNQVTVDEAYNFSNDTLETDENFSKKVIDEILLDNLKKINNENLLDLFEKYYNINYNTIIGFELNNYNKTPIESINNLNDYIHNVSFLQTLSGRDPIGSTSASDKLLDAKFKYVYFTCHAPYSDNIPGWLLDFIIQLVHIRYSSNIDEYDISFTAFIAPDEGLVIIDKLYVIGYNQGYWHSSIFFTGKVNYCIDKQEINEAYNFSDVSDTDEVSSDRIMKDISDSIKLETSLDIAKKIYLVIFLLNDNEIEIKPIENIGIAIYSPFANLNTKWNKFRTFQFDENIDELLADCPFNIRQLLIPFLKQLAVYITGIPDLLTNEEIVNNVRFDYSLYVSPDKKVIGISFFRILIDNSTHEYKSSSDRKIFNLSDCVILLNTVDYDACLTLLKYDEEINESFDFQDNTLPLNNELIISTSEIIQDIVHNHYKEIFTNHNFRVEGLQNIWNIAENSYAYEFDWYGCLSMPENSSLLSKDYFNLQWDLQGQIPENYYHAIRDFYRHITNSDDENIYIDFLRIGIIPGSNIIPIYDISFKNYQFGNIIITTPEFNWLTEYKKLSMNELFNFNNTINEAFDFNDATADDNKQTSKLNNQIYKDIDLQTLKDVWDIKKLLKDYYGIAKFKKMPYIMENGDYGNVFSDIDLADRSSNSVLSLNNLLYLQQAGFTHISEDKNSELYHKYCDKPIMHLLNKLYPKEDIKAGERNYDVWLSPDNGLYVIYILFFSRPNERWTSPLRTIIGFTGEVTYTGLKPKAQISAEQTDMINQNIKIEKFFRSLVKAILVNYSTDANELAYKVFETPDKTLGKMIATIHQMYAVSGLSLYKTYYVNNNKTNLLQNLRMFIYGNTARIFQVITNTWDTTKYRFVQEFQDPYNLINVIITNDTDYLDSINNNTVNYKEIKCPVNVMFKHVANPYLSDIYCAIILTDRGMKIWNEFANEKTISVQKVKSKLLSKRIY